MLKYKGPALAFSALVALIPIGGLFSYLYPYEVHDRAKSYLHPDHSSKEEVDKLVALFTGGLVIIGVAQAALFFWQLSLIREGLADAKEFADAARDTAKGTNDAVALARETSERQLRAYVLVERAELAINGNELIILIKIKNSGSTPAYRVEIRPRNIFYDDAETTAIFNLNGRITQTPLGPESPRDMTIHFDELPYDKASGIFTDFAALFRICGEIAYFDVFNRERTTYFNLIRYGGHAFAGKPMAFSEQGNDAD